MGERAEKLFRKRFSLGIDICFEEKQQHLDEETHKMFVINEAINDAFCEIAGRDDVSMELAGKRDISADFQTTREPRNFQDR